MRQDEQIYRRASAAALIGFVVQTLLTVAVLLAAFWTGDKLLAESRSLFAIALHLAGGLPIWFILWLIYYQHRLERLESFESERLSQTDQQAAALFDEHADDLNISRKRLRNLYKYGINGISVMLAIILIIAGSLFSWFNFKGLLEPGLASPVDAANLASTRLMVITLAIAFVGFVAARYVSGLTKVKEWQLLRGGAAYLMGSALLGLIALIASAGSAWDYPKLFTWLSVIVPLITTLTGIEITLSLLMGAYRPRRPGEIPRPAFDSRMLGWLTSPESMAKIVGETINYQFGFEVSKSWFYRLLGKSFVWLVLFGVLVMALLSTVVIVGPQEQAIVTNMGQIDDNNPLDSGLHIKRPWPFATVEKYPVHRVQQIVVGSTNEPTAEGRAILWTNEHTEGEELMITAPRRLPDEPTDSESGAMGLAAAQIVIHYKVKNLMDLVKAVPDAHTMLAGKTNKERHKAAKLLVSIADRRVSTYFATRTIDTLLGHDGTSAGAQLRTDIQKDIDQVGLGLDILFVGLSGIHPPQADGVANSFLEQIGAQQEEQTIIENAKANAIRILTSQAGSYDMGLKINKEILNYNKVRDELSQLEIDSPDDKQAIEAKRQEMVRKKIAALTTIIDSRGEAAVAIHDASAVRWRIALSERAKVLRFTADREFYRIAPNYYKAKRRLEAIERALAGTGTRKIIASKKVATEGIVRFNFDADSGDLSGTGENN